MAVHARRCRRCAGWCEHEPTPDFRRTPERLARRRTGQRGCERRSAGLAAARTPRTRRACASGQPTATRCATHFAPVLDEPVPAAPARRGLAACRVGRAGPRPPLCRRIAADGRAGRWRWATASDRRSACCLQAVGGGGRLFHQRGVLLRGLVQLRDGLADLLDALALLAGGRGDLADQVRHALGLRHHVVASSRRRPAPARRRLPPWPPSRRSAT
jgi:hypothetical protein